MYDCCEQLVVLLGGLSKKKKGPSPRITFDEPTFGPLQRPEYKVPGIVEKLVRSTGEVPRKYLIS